MRPNAFFQIFAAVAFGLGFVGFGLGAFIRLGHAQQQLEARLQGIGAGQIQPDALTVVRKYVNPGKGGSAHIVFSGNRQPGVNLAVTRDYFNSVNLGETVPGYYFPDGYFIPQNRTGDAGGGRWFLLGLGVLLGAVAFVLAFATTRAARRHLPS